MSSKNYAASEAPIDSMPKWFIDLLGIEYPAEQDIVTLGEHKFRVRGGILRSLRELSEAQQQTSKSFGFKWGKRDTFERPEQLKRVRDWLVERYGSVASSSWIRTSAEPPVLLDAGCGGAMSAIELFGSELHKLRYVGVDVSDAVEVATARFAERGLSGGFIQTDLAAIPLPQSSVDLIFSEGVLHHADSTRAAFDALLPLLKVHGRFLFYVYRKKGPIREFTDDYIRVRIQEMDPESAWNSLLSLTRLGKALGDLDVDLEVPEPVDLLNIPAGKVDLQRFFYWHVCKAFYRKEYSIDELQHINFDWYAPKNAHRHTPDEVRLWCAESGLDIEREVIEESGITIVARKVAD